MDLIRKTDGYGTIKMGYYDPNNNMFVLHNEGDNPAVIEMHDSGNTTLTWYKHGMCHRENGPAYLSFEGIEFYYRDDKHHREDGPAVAYTDSYVNSEHDPGNTPYKQYQYYYEGVEIAANNLEEFKKLISYMKF